MKNILKKYNIDAVWHFTDEENLESIQEHGGIFSLEEIEERGILVAICGGNEWSHDADQQKGVDQYVHLAFVKDHPMLYKLKKSGKLLKPVWLKIDPTVILGEGVRFTNAVANKKGVPILDADDAKELIDFDILFTRMDWRNPMINFRRQQALKSEVLIPKCVPIDMIVGYTNG